MIEETKKYLRLKAQSLQEHIIITGKRGNAVYVFEKGWSPIQEMPFIAAEPGRMADDDRAG